LGQKHPARIFVDGGIEIVDLERSTKLNQTAAYWSGSVDGYVSQGDIGCLARDMAQDLGGGYPTVAEVGPSKKQKPPTWGFYHSSWVLLH
jgi:hypothetical protein